jgi:hypothetical protein
VNAETRFFAQVREADDCWVWAGRLSPNGYGRFGRGTPAHRWSWEFFRGEIPTGLHLDHLCRNKACVNPEHLDPVTQAENNRRAAASQTHCHEGHPLSGDNLVLHGPQRHWRRCRTCTNTKQNLRRRKAA